MPALPVPFRRRPWWHAVAVALLLLPLAGCVPLPVGRAEVAAEAACLPDDFPDTVAAGPARSPGRAYRFGHHLGACLDRLVLGDPEAAWPAWFGADRAGEASLREIADARARAIAAPPAHVVVVGHEPPDRLQSETEFAVFYSRSRQSSWRHAWLLVNDGGRWVPWHCTAEASAQLRDGWFPGTPLMLTRMYTHADTATAAMQALAREVARRLAAAQPVGPVPVVVLAGG